jgi:hypothetical protein
VGIAKALYVGTNVNIAGTTNLAGLTASSAVATDASKNLVSVTNTGTGNNVLATSPTLVTPVLGAASATSITVDAGAVGTPSITTTGDTNTGIFFPAADTIAFSEGGVESMRIDSSGNVGIGNATARAHLDVNDGTVNTNGDAVKQVAITAAHVSSVGTSTGLLTIQSNDAFAVNKGGSIAFGGRYETANTGGANWAFISGLKSTATSGEVGGYLQFATRSEAGSVTEAMRIDSSGNFIIGGTTAVGQLNVIAPANTKTEIYMNKSSQVEAHIGFKTSTDSNWYFGTGATLGTYGLYQANTGTAWIAVSDERFKTELQPIENALEKVSGIRAVTGRYSYDEENGVTKRRAFLIAQDFLTALPEAVDTQDPEKYGLSYSDTIPLLYAAIKEQQALITDLTARITALEKK